MDRGGAELTEVDLVALDAYLGTVDGGAVPNAEALDGFFAALICCPDLVMPSEYLPVIQGGETEDGDMVFDSMEDAQRFMDLIRRHWNHVNDQLTRREAYLPLLLEDDDGNVQANDWANGFLEGSYLRPDIWSDLAGDEENGGSLVPIFALAHEHDPDPELRPYNEPIDMERREDLIVGAAAGVMRLHAYFLAHRNDYLTGTGTFARTYAKVGRNAPCPCGSGEKYKRCCGRGPTLH